MSTSSVDFEASPADTRRKAALRILLALAVLGVCALVAVGVALGVTQMHTSQSTPQSPLRLGYTVTGAGSRANRNILNRHNYGRAEMARVQGTFDAAGFKAAVKNGDFHTFHFELPGRAEPLAVETKRWREDMGSFFWTGHIDTESHDQRVKVIIGAEVLGTIRLDGHFWQISGTEDDVVVTQLDRTAPEMRMQFHHPISNRSAVPLTLDPRRSGSVRTTLGSESPQSILKYSETSKAHQFPQSARAERSHTFGSSTRNSISGRATYESIRILIVLNYNSLNNCAASSKTIFDNVMDSIEDAWVTAMNMPSPEYVFICHKYWTQSYTGTTSDLTQAMLALAADTTVQSQRYELGADLVLGVQTFSVTALGGYAAGSVLRDAYDLDVNPHMFAAFAVMNSATNIVDLDTAVHEFGHLFNMRHDRLHQTTLGFNPNTGQITQLCGTNSAIPWTKRCNYGGNANSGSGPSKMLSIMSYNWDPNQSPTVGPTCNPPLTEASWGATKVPVYSGYSYNGVSLGSSSCTQSATSNYNRYNFESLWNVIALYYPRLPVTCPSTNKGCKKDWTPYTSAQKPHSSLAWTLMDSSFAGEYYISEFKNYDKSSCRNLQSYSTSGEVKSQPCTKGRTTQKWTIATNTADYQLPKPANAFGNSPRFTITTRAHSRDYRVFSGYDKEYPGFPMAGIYKYEHNAANSNLNDWDKHDYGVGDFYIWCLPSQVYQGVDNADFCVLAGLDYMFMLRTDTSSGVNKPYTPFFGIEHLDDAQVWVFQKTSKSTFYWE